MPKTTVLYFWLTLYIYVWKWFYFITYPARLQCRTPNISLVEAISATGSTKLENFTEVPTVEAVRACLQRRGKMGPRCMDTCPLVCGSLFDEQLMYSAYPILLSRLQQWITAWDCWPPLSICHTLINLFVIICKEYWKWRSTQILFSELLRTASLCFNHAATFCLNDVPLRASNDCASEYKGMIRHHISGHCVMPTRSVIMSRIV